MAFDLSSILADVPKSGTNREQITYLPLSRLEPDAGNFYAVDSVEQLAANIQTVGLQQPIRVRAIPDSDKYAIVSGHRRYAALTLLSQDEDGEKWTEAACIIERDEISPELRQLRLIYANSATRVMTSAEKAEEARQVEELLYKLKEQGYAFPGRMRDHVAEAVRLSKTKLAKLRKIQNGLIPEWMVLWKEGKLADETADILAGAKGEYQALLYKAYGDQCRRNRYGTGLYSEKAKDMIQNFGAIENSDISCPDKDGAPCHWKRTMLAVQANSDSYGRICYGCCKNCSSLLSCKNRCGYAEPLVKAKRGEAAKKASETKAKADQRFEPDRQILVTTYGRVRALREAKGISQEDFLRSSNGCFYDDLLKKMEKAESGKPRKDSQLPGGIWPNEARKLIAAADLLGCSIDYLLGRTDVVEMATGEAGVQAAGDSWHTGEPEEPGEYMCCLASDGYSCFSSLTWNGDSWVMFNGERLPDDDSKMIACWIGHPVIDNDDATWHRRRLC